MQTARFDAREMIVNPGDVRGDRGVGDGAGSGDEGESSCEDVQRTRLMMRCRRGARSRGAIRVPGRSRPGGVRPRQSYTSRMGMHFGVCRAAAVAKATAGRGRMTGAGQPSARTHPPMTESIVGDEGPVDLK